MATLSYVLGFYSTQFIPLSYVRWISTCLFILFGLQMLYESVFNRIDGNFKELQEVEEDLDQSLLSDPSYSFSSQDSNNNNQIKSFNIE